MLGTLMGPAGAQTFSDSTDVVVVEVPVQVLRQGRPVEGLTAEDFEVWEGRRRLPVSGFEILDLNAPETMEPVSPGEPSPPVAARRHFLMLFDLAFSSPKALGQARGAALGLLDRLHPADLVAVATYLPSKGPQLLLAFTPDRQKARAALDRIGKPELYDYAGAPIHLALRDPIAFNTSGSAGPASNGGGGRSQERREAVADAKNDGDTPFTVMLDPAEQVSRQRAVSAMANGYSGLAKALGALYGRKYVLLFSEGFDAALFQGTADEREQSAMAAAAASGAIWGVDSEKRFGSARTRNDLEAMLTELRRADCVVHAVDIGGLRDRGAAHLAAGGRDSLFLLADATGGELYENFNDLGAAMDQMLRRTSVTYLLVLQPEGLPRNGAYHRLRVEVRNAPRGTRVLHRPGFYAPRPAQPGS